VIVGLIDDQSRGLPRLYLHTVLSLAVIAFALVLTVIIFQFDDMQLLV
jgi:hypothetical protein